MSDNGVRIHRSNLHTEFATRYKGESRAGTKGDIIGALRIVRVFHPVRGEETQLEIEAGRDMPVGTARGDRKKTTRVDRSLARMSLSPQLAEQMACALLGQVWKPPAEKPNGMSPSLNVAMNEYTPRHYDQMTENEKRISREAFAAGYDYRESLIPEGSK